MFFLSNTFEASIARLCLGLICLALSLPASAQSEFSSDSLYQFNYHLSSTHVPASVDNARLQVRVYAYDYMLADVSAVVLKEIYVVKPESDSIYSVSFSGTELKKALQRYHGSERLYSDHGAGVYLIWTLDLNGDGLICEGDLRLDYDKTGDLFYSIRPGSSGIEKTILVHLSPVQSGSCKPFE